MLHSWDCETLKDLECRILETEGRICDLRRRGLLEMAAEEEDDLKALQETQADIKDIQEQSDVQGQRNASVDDSIGTTETRDGWVSVGASSLVNPNTVEPESGRSPPSVITQATPLNLRASSFPTGALPPAPEILNRGEISESSLITPESFEIFKGSRLEAMPDCAEKSLLFLLDFFKSEHKRLLFTDLASIGRVQNDSLTDVFYKLVDHQLEEKTASPAEKDLQDLKALFDQYVTNNTVEPKSSMREQVERLCEVLQRVINTIRKLDVALLLSSVRGSNMTAKLIQDKDIIVLLGSTGVGKSTIMHFLAGSKMRVIDVEGVPHLEPVDVIRGLEGVKGSCSSISETTGINAVTIEMNGETCIICDTAGLDDTRGVEYDIACGIVMANAIQSARSVKLVLVMDQGMLGGKLLSLRKILIPAIIKLMPSFKDHVGSIFYLFNNVSNPLSVIGSRLTEMSMNLGSDEKAVVDFASMITDLARKSRNGVGATVVDLIEGDCKNLLQKLKGITPIINPKTVFNHFASPSSISKLVEQLNLHKSAIMKGLDNYEISRYEGDLLLVDFKLRELLNLHLLVGLPECKGCYVETLKETCCFVYKAHCRIFQLVKSWFENDIVYNEDTDFSACIKEVKFLFELKCIRDPHVRYNTESDNEIGKIDVQEIIVGLILRMQEACKENVKLHIRKVVDQSTIAPTQITNTDGSLASTQLFRMRNIAHRLEKGICNKCNKYYPNNSNNDICG